MSQEKVDRYKKEKANREKIMRRERWITRLEVTAFVVVLATLIGWFSVAVYQNSVAEKKANRTKETTTMNVTDIQNYLSETPATALMLPIHLRTAQQIRQVTAQQIPSAKVQRNKQNC